MIICKRCDEILDRNKIAKEREKRRKMREEKTWRKNEIRNIKGIRR